MPIFFNSLLVQFGLTPEAVILLRHQNKRAFPRRQVGSTSRISNRVHTNANESQPYRIRLQRYKGPQICPFAREPHENLCQRKGDKRFASIDWSISNSRNDTQLSGPGLIVHLISAHGFFEGIHSPYRVPPRKLAEPLELGSCSRASEVSLLLLVPTRRSSIKCAKNSLRYQSTGRMDRKWTPRCHRWLQPRAHPLRRRHHALVG